MSARTLQTLDGHFVMPLAMEVADVRIKDIAHALSMSCRFNGYVSRFYSVAEHSVYVARVVAMTIAKQYGFQHWRDVLEHPIHRIRVRKALLHDATEAYLPDMTYPVKQEMPEFRDVEDRLALVLAVAFEYSTEHDKLIKDVDRRMATTEAVYLLGGLTKEVWFDYAKQWPAYDGPFDVIDRYDVAPALARRRFLDFYDQVK